MYISTKHLNRSDFCYFKKLQDAIFSFQHFKKCRNLPTFVEIHIFASDFFKTKKIKEIMLSQNSLICFIFRVLKKS